MLVLIFVGISFVIGCSFGQTNNAICVGKPKGPFADEEDPNCQSYFICIAGQFRHDESCKKMETGNGMMFYDPVTQLCSSAYKCPSLMHPETIAKMCAGFTLYIPRADKSDRSCKTYYYCMRDNIGRLTIKKVLCDEGSRFDPFERQCSRKYNDMCPTLKNENSAHCINKDKGPHADEDDPTCNNYYYCMPGNLKIMRYCDAYEDENSMPMYYNPEKKRCMSYYKCPFSTKNPPKKTFLYTNALTGTNYPVYQYDNGVVISNQQTSHSLVFNDHQPDQSVVISNQQPGHGVVINTQHPGHGVVINNQPPAHGVLISNPQSLVTSNDQTGQGLIFNNQHPYYGPVMNNQQLGPSVSISNQHPGYGIVFSNQKSSYGMPISNQQPGNSVVIGNQVASNPLMGGYGINLGASPHNPYQQNPNMDIQAYNQQTGLVY